MYIFPKCPRCSTAIRTHSDDAIEMFQQRLYVGIQCTNCNLDIQMRDPDKEDFIASLKPDRVIEPDLDFSDEHRNQTGEPDGDTEDTTEG